MNRLEKLTRLTVILVLLAVVRINYQLSIPGDGNIEEYGFRDWSATAIKSAEMPIMETL